MIAVTLEQEVRNTRWERHITEAGGNVAQGVTAGRRVPLGLAWTVGRSRLLTCAQIRCAAETLRGAEYLIPTAIGLRALDRGRALAHEGCVGAIQACLHEIE